MTWRPPVSTRHPMRVLRSLPLLLGAVIGAGAQAHNVVLRPPVAVALAAESTRRIVGDLSVRFGTAANAEIDGSDLQVEGSASPNGKDWNMRPTRRPTDEELCHQAFDDAMTHAAYFARRAGAVAIVGVVSDFKGVIFDDPAAYECHIGSAEAYVWLRVRLARSKPHTLPVPAKSGYAALDDLEELPTDKPGAKERYAHFLTLPRPRALVFLDDGSWRFWADDPDAMTKALDDCAAAGHKCWLYAVDDNVVWNADEERRIGTVAQLRDAAPKLVPAPLQKEARQ